MSGSRRLAVGVGAACGTAGLARSPGWNAAGRRAPVGRRSVRGAARAGRATPNRPGPARAARPPAGRGAGEPFGSAEIVVASSDVPFASTVPCAMILVPTAGVAVSPSL